LLFFNRQERVHRGERASVLCLKHPLPSSNRVELYAQLFHWHSMSLAALVQRETQNGFELSNAVDAE
jgi:hypothetical protein